MPDLAGRGPLGQKAPKQPKGPRKPIPKQSRKRKAYLASQARVDGLAHMGKVAECGCFVCGARPVEVHHMTVPRDDMKVAPLCPPHHRREFGPGAFHYSPSAFYEKHGDRESILQRVAEMIASPARS